MNFFTIETKKYSIILSQDTLIIRPLTGDGTEKDVEFEVLIDDAYQLIKEWINE